MTTAAQPAFYTEKFDIRINTTKQLWNNLNKIAALSKMQNSTGITKITYNNEDIIEPKEICNGLNEYFCSTGANFVQSLQPCGQFDFEKYCSYSCKNSMFCSPVSAEEIIKIVCKYPNNKAPGRDNIKSKILKEISSYIVDPLVYIQGGPKKRGHSTFSQISRKLLKISK